MFYGLVTDPWDRAAPAGAEVRCARDAAPLGSYVDLAAGPVIPPRKRIHHILSKQP